MLFAYHHCISSCYHRSTPAGSSPWCMAALSLPSLLQEWIWWAVPKKKVGVVPCYLHTSCVWPHPLLVVNQSALHMACTCMVFLSCALDKYTGEQASAWLAKQEQMVETSHTH